MENPRRTAEHLDRVAQRRQSLRGLLSTLLIPREPFTLEIGCGHGHFLNAYAATTSAENVCLGLDVIAERIARANRKKVRAHLGHLHFLHASAEDFFTVLPPGCCLDRIFILFPDPWPKRRHHKNRLMQPDFLRILSSRATAKTRLYFRTDDGEYFSEASAVLQDGTSGWQILEELWPFEHETVFQQRAPSFQSLIAGPRPVVAPAS